jgi:uncharacterized protein YjbJ (UPF0337 family)
MRIRPGRVGTVVAITGAKGGNTMNRDQVEGKAREIAGKAKQKVGDLTDNQDLKDEGAADEVVGQAQNTVGHAKENVGNAIKDLGERIKK